MHLPMTYQDANQEKNKIILLTQHLVKRHYMWKILMFVNFIRANISIKWYILNLESEKTYPRVPVTVAKTKCLILLVRFGVSTMEKITCSSPSINRLEQIFTHFFWRKWQDTSLLKRRKNRIFHKAIITKIMFSGTDIVVFVICILHSNISSKFKRRNPYIYKSRMKEWPLCFLNAILLISKVK